MINSYKAQACQAQCLKADNSSDTRVPSRVVESLSTIYKVNNQEQFHCLK